MSVDELRECDEVKGLIARGRDVGVLTYAEIVDATAELDLDDSDVEAGRKVGPIAPAPQSLPVAPAPRLGTLARRRWLSGWGSGGWPQGQHLWTVLLLKRERDGKSQWAGRNMVGSLARSASSKPLSLSGRHLRSEGQRGGWPWPPQH